MAAHLPSRWPDAAVANAPTIISTVTWHSDVSHPGLVVAGVIALLHARLLERIVVGDRGRHAARGGQASHLLVHLEPPPDLVDAGLEPPDAAAAPGVRLLELLHPLEQHRELARVPHPDRDGAADGHGRGDGVARVHQLPARVDPM